MGRGAREMWGDSLDESTEVSTQTKHEVEIIVNSVKLVKKLVFSDINKLFLSSLHSLDVKIIKKTNFSFH